MKVNFVFMKNLAKNELTAKYETRLKEIGITKSDFMSHFNLTSQRYNNWRNRGIPKGLIIDAADFAQLDAGELKEGKIVPIRPNTPSDSSDSLETVTRVQELPLISWIQAGNPEKVEDIYHAGEYEEMMPVSKRYSKHSFALRVRGDSMQSSTGASFPEGCVICVDPEISPDNGTFVVAKFPNSDEATFKQLVIEGGERYLKPLNDRYPIIPIDEEVQICGVVRQFLMDV